VDQSAISARSIVDNVRQTGSPSPSVRLLLRLLDELEYGMVLLDGEGRLHYSNALGRDELRSGRVLQLDDEVVTSSDCGRRLAFRKALVEAFKGRRQLLTFTIDGLTSAVAVTPLPEADDIQTGGCTRYALLVFGKRPQGINLAIDFFARAHGLTGAESAVLVHLARGLDPNVIAQHQRVAISTIRSQIASIRAKTGTGSIRALLDCLGMLPPIRTVLRTTSHRLTEVAR
jgi:DNA-binding CsgD family transcriptional regulator